MEPDPIGLGGGLNTYGYAYQSPLRYYDPTGEFPIAGAIGGVVTGYLLSKLTGCDYSFSDALLDGALGAAGVGLASKLNKLNRIRKLRNLARRQNMQSTGRRGSVESYRGANGERLNIKHRSGTASGLQQGSRQPRFDYRTRPGTNSSRAEFRDPFTGRTGPKGDLSHVPLEPPLSNTAAGAAGAAGGALSEAGESALSDCGCQ